MVVVIEDLVRLDNLLKIGGQRPEKTDKLQKSGGSIEQRPEKIYKLLESGGNVEQGPGKTLHTPDCNVVEVVSEDLERLYKLLESGGCGEQNPGKT